MKTYIMDRVMRFVNAYCAKYGAKCLLVAEHNDEKTKHYHIIFTNYNFEKHANLRLAADQKQQNLAKSYKIWEQRHLKARYFVEAK